jgi:hypothetical protein
MYIEHFFDRCVLFSKIIRFYFIGVFPDFLDTLYMYLPSLQKKILLDSSSQHISLLMAKVSCAALILS